MTKEQLQKYLNGKYSDEELDNIINWINNEALSEENKEIGFEDWNSFVEVSSSEDDEKFTFLFDNILNKIEAKNRLKKRTTNFISYFSKVAAIILLPVSIYLILNPNEKKPEKIRSVVELSVDSLEIIAPIGSRTVVQLSDGTEVYLNYGSTLKYPQVFSDNSREVTLSGEAYFEVAHNPEKPFIVKAGELNIKALGTSFNVLAYPNKNLIETTLIDGKLLVENTDINNVKTSNPIEPGQHLEYNTKSGENIVTSDNIDKYIGWKEGKLIFEDDPITEIADRLGKMFNVDIEVSEDALDYPITVTLVDEPLFQILDLITIATPVEYKALPRKKLPDGTFSKQKIIISNKKTN